jgi:hypothetical protein
VRGQGSSRCRFVVIAFAAIAAYAFVPQAFAGYGVQPVDGATTSPRPSFLVYLDDNDSLPIVFVASTPDRDSLGFPVNEVGSCTPTAPWQEPNKYTCQPAFYTPSYTSALPPGTYHWWLSFWRRDPAHTVEDATLLPASAHFTGKSVKQTRLSQAAYQLSKALRRPRSVAVACWSDADWAGISGDNPESDYSTLGFWRPQMPHWVNLSPRICRAMETLLYHRPQYPNAITANAVDTLTHEMLRALGIRNEAQHVALPRGRSMGSVQGPQLAPVARLPLTA